MRGYKAAAAAILMAAALVGCSHPEDKTAQGLVTGPKGPQTYTVQMDAASPEGKNQQFAAYFPSRLRVGAGDTVVFENRSTQAPHTVTFGFEPGAAGIPGPVTKAGAANPLVFGPCFSDTLPAADAEACGAQPPATPPPYAGKGFWNSGAIAPMTGSEPQRVALTIAPDATPGTYIFTCLLHPTMAGGLEVITQETQRHSAEQAQRKTDSERAAVMAGAAKIADPTPAEGVSVVAGWGTPVVAVNRFAPAVVNVKVGQTVTWKATSPYEPHTVTFDSKFKTPEDPGVFSPGGVASGSGYSGGFANSGLLGPQPFPTDTFSLVFNKAGTYSYTCVLHPGMTGQVVVTK